MYFNTNRNTNKVINCDKETIDGSDSIIMGNNNTITGNNVSIIGNENIINVLNSKITGNENTINYAIDSTIIGNGNIIYDGYNIRIIGDSNIINKNIKQLTVSGQKTIYNNGKNSNNTTTPSHFYESTGFNPGSISNNSNINHSFNIGGKSNRTTSINVDVNTGIMCNNIPSIHQSFNHNNVSKKKIKKTPEEKKKLLLDYLKLNIGHDEDAKGGDSCCLCLTNIKKVTLLKCCHLCCCIGCSILIIEKEEDPKCPLCRINISECLVNKIV